MSQAGHVLDKITFEPDEKNLLARMYLQRGSKTAEKFLGILNQAVRIARPKAACRLCSVSCRNDDQVVVDDVTLTSRLLNRQLQDVRCVFVGLSTCGREVADWAARFEPLLERFWLDTIMEDALREADDHLNAYIRLQCKANRVSTIFPGSLRDWPLCQQKQVFNLMMHEASSIGIELLDSLLMQPMKSLSRITFNRE